jgi:hypothetical protein
LFLWRRERGTDKRAKQVARMVTLIVHGLQTKSYDDFVDSFSNPGSEPGPLERLQRRLCFQMRMLPTCWYDARAEYPADGTPSFYIEGGGDDFGVLISGDAIADHSIGVDFWVPTNSQAGRDAHEMVHTLRGMPGWSRASDIEVASFAAMRHASPHERLERALKAAADEGERKLKLFEEKRAKLNNGPLGGSLAERSARLLDGPLNGEPT